MRFPAAIVFIFSFGISFGQSRDEYKGIVDSLMKVKPISYIISFFHEELKQKPKDETVLRWIGYLYVADNQLEPGEKYYRDALAVNPSCSRCYANLGRIYTIRKDNRKALELLNESIRIDPSDVTAYLIRASVKAGMNDFPGALADYDQSIVLEPKRADCYIDRARFNIGQKNYTPAIADLNKAVKLAPEYYFPYYLRARIYFEQNMHNEALRDINAAIHLDTSEAELYVGRAAIYSYYNEHEKAFADYERAIRIDPNDYFTYYSRAQEKYILEDMDGYCNDIHTSYDLVKERDPKNPLGAEMEGILKVYCNPTSASYYYQRGIAFYNLQKFSDAVEIYTLGLKQFPENAMLFSFRGNAYLAQMDFNRALPDYYAAIKYGDNIAREFEINNKKDHPEAGTAANYARGLLATTYVSIAQSKFALHQYREALEDINRGIEMAPEMKEYGLENYYNVRGNIYLAIENYQQALKDFNKCIEINPGFALAYANRAVAEINLSAQVRLTSGSVWFSSDQLFHVNWMLPSKTRIKKTDPRLNAALLDVNRAIELDSQSFFAYYIRGLIRKVLAQDNYCSDFLKAGNGGYPVQMDLIKGCR